MRLAILAVNYLTKNGMIGYKNYGLLVYFVTDLQIGFSCSSWKKWFRSLNSEDLHVSCVEFVPCSGSLFHFMQDGEKNPLTHIGKEKMEK